jgi:hypothetical protein
MYARSDKLPLQFDFSKGPQICFRRLIATPFLESIFLDVSIVYIQAFVQSRVMKESVSPSRGSRV